MTLDKIKYHIDYIKNMSKYDLKSFLKFSHKNHIYFTVDILNHNLKKCIKENNV